MLYEPYWQAAAVLAAYALLCWACLRKPTGIAHPAAGASEILIGYASQGGEGQALAEALSGALAHQGAVQVLPLNAVDETCLVQHKIALFVVSTYGEGEPPDSGLKFSHRWLRSSSEKLSHLHYAVLALGDKTYQHYCGFGVAVDSALANHGGQRMFPATQIDRLSEADLDLWQQRLQQAGLLQVDDHSLVKTAPEQRHGLVLSSRRHLNSGSPGGALYHLQFKLPEAEIIHWQAGDIAVLHLPKSATGESAQRKYSIASLSSSGQLDLLVRLVNKDDGGYGLGSGFLCQQLTPGSRAEFCLQTNAAFHGPTENLLIEDAADVTQSPSMILIGNGSGLAGLRAHLLQAIENRSGGHWLVFGERTKKYDSVFAGQLEGWQQQGVLAELDRVFSRDGGELRYVQDVLQQKSQQLLQWVNAGAFIFVCGSQQRMAPAVHRVLVDVLGEDRVEQLILQGRYRRDIY
ncbi:NADPH cytochrome P450 oxidoreductase family protein [Halioxenophilus aromaticivorans]|uniref:NADPH--hemoprotein reductase n=1 Tax=Halioxenophilus aromaticivorans TaxID=1306992 RepID=A0AAV3U432_9ALTE